MLKGKGFFAVILMCGFCLFFTLGKPEGREGISGVGETGDWRENAE